MTPERWQLIKEIYPEALAIGDAERRRVYLDATCAQDSELRREIERLMASGQKADPFWSDGSLQGQMLGSYQIIEKLSHKPTGIVYKARDTRLERWVILKLLPSVLLSDTDSKARLLREALCMPSHGMCGRRDLGIEAFA
jgi:serine/threonine protein kinase